MLKASVTSSEGYPGGSPGDLPALPGIPPSLGAPDMERGSTEARHGGWASIPAEGRKGRGQTVIFSRPERGVDSKSLGAFNDAVALVEDFGEQGALQIPE